MKIFFWKYRLARKLAACGLLIPAPLLAAPLNTNLVINPSFEDINEDAELGPYNSMKIFDWEDFDGDEDDNYAYDYSQGYSGYPEPDDSGYYYFWGGQGTAPGQPQVFQLIDVSAGPSADLIAAGSASYALNAFFSTYLEQADASRVRAIFRNASNQELGTADVGGAAFVGSLPVTAGQTDWGQDSAAGTIPIGTTSVEIQILAEVGVPYNDGYVDLVDFQVTDLILLPVLNIQVDRDTGSVTLSNRTGQAVPLSGYSILSEYEALDGAQWRSIAGNYDADSGGGVDPNRIWTEVSPREIGGVLAEEQQTPGLPASLSAGQNIDLGTAVWLPSPTEDVTFNYVSQGETVRGVVSFVGNEGKKFAPGDLSFDGQIDAQDWELFRAGQHVVVESGSAAQAYGLGDLNGDLINNHTDFVIFKSLYDQANGPGAFEVMVNSVPEGSTGFLLLVGWGLLTVCSRRRSS
jgi:hypothetical protein